ncbi:hypothetical protein [Sphingomonas sp.]|jgi:hypothetical protein|uniref:hypothetical protein n=1 Tax=Sphingomonas sp. TaxID=28214 RepID=UPI002E3482AB|nr:hypothetical protein [Sphingomonas sp.]HEX4693075.1 hypothetical protein [Sphingomonas sp.]
MTRSPDISSVRLARILLVPARIAIAALIVGPILAYFLEAFGQFDFGIPFSQWRFRTTIDAIVDWIAIAFVAMLLFGLPLTALVCSRVKTGLGRLGALAAAGAIANVVLFVVLLGPYLELAAFTAICGAMAGLIGGLVNYDRLRRPHFTFV